MPAGQNHRLYACAGITVVPDPPQVGVPTTISLKLMNNGAEQISIQHIELLVARFGIGMNWEYLTTVGALNIPAYERAQVSSAWTPAFSGHCGVRAHIMTNLSDAPAHVGRNLRIMKAITPGIWRTPFVLGNPLDQPAEIQLVIEHDPRLVAMLIVNERALVSGETIALAGREETEGVLLLLAPTDEVLISMTTVEAFIVGQFVDGMAVLATTLDPQADAQVPELPGGTPRSEPSDPSDPGGQSRNWSLWRP